MPIPRYPQLDRLLHTLHGQAEGRWRAGIELLVNELAEDLAGGDGKFGFKWVCNFLEDLAAEGFPISPDLYRQVADAGRSVGASEEQWKKLEPYVA
jgi:hypothetical protein